MGLESSMDRGADDGVSQQIVVRIARLQRKQRPFSRMYRHREPRRGGRIVLINHG